MRSSADTRGAVAMDAPVVTNRHLYSDDNPSESVPFAKKAELLEEVDAFVREQDKNAKQVRVGLQFVASGQNHSRKRGCSQRYSPDLTSLSLLAAGNVSKWVM